MLTLITRYVAIVAVSMHLLLCGNAYCCTKTCSVKDDAASVSLALPLSSCPCHSEKHGHGTDGKNFCRQNSDHNCGHQHHFCKCFQAAHPNSGTGFRVVLNQNLLSFSIPFLSATTLLPVHGLIHQASETVGNSSGLGVRLHLLLEHFLI